MIKVNNVFSSELVTNQRHGDYMILSPKRSSLVKTLFSKKKRHGTGVDPMKK